MMPSSPETSARDGARPRQTHRYQIRGLFVNAQLVMLALLAMLLPVAPVSAAPGGYPRELTPGSIGLPSNLTQAEFSDALRTAARAWSYPTHHCSGVQFVVNEPVAEWRAALDGLNMIVFRDESWCHNERCGRASSFPRTAAAMTTPYFDGARQTPREADMEINAIGLLWRRGSAAVDQSEATARPYAMLEPVLVHELGHWLGFTDTCGSEHYGPPRVDCSTVERESVMFSGSNRAQLSRWDVDRLCAAFPRTREQTAPRRSTPISPALAAFAVAAITGVCVLAYQVTKRGRAAG
jgi:hypothetical protein